MKRKSPIVRMPSKVQFISKSTVPIEDDSSSSRRNNHNFTMLSTNSPLNKSRSQQSLDDSSRQSSTLLQKSNEEIIRPQGCLSQGILGDFRFACGKFVNHSHFESFITFIIFCNTILLILGTFDFAKDNQDTANVFSILDSIFLLIFTCESGLQFIYRDMKLFKNRWLTFDFLLVSLSWAFQTFTVLRALRILKIASKISSLQLLITALIAVIPNITAIFSLLMLVFYIFAVMFTTLFKDLELSADYFSRLDKTLFSLFQFMTMDWQDAAREVQQYVSWAPVLFVIFEIVSGFIVFNLIVAVLCEALGLIEKKAEGDAKSAVDCEREETMQSLMEKIESIRAYQREITKSLEELSSEEFSTTMSS